MLSFKDMKTGIDVTIYPNKVAYVRDLNSITPKTCEIGFDGGATLVIDEPYGVVVQKIDFNRTV